jgi:peptidoglycan/xylan/chitin deacetylase (PgdA/CDA1 family)
MIKNPVPWPNGARCAVAITFDMDSDSVLHLDHPKRADTLVSTASWLKYDQIAVPRILDMYKKYDLRQTFFVPGWCIEKYPKSVEAILEGGHEIAHHGYLHENPNHLSADEEYYWFQRGIETIEKFTGQRPRGFRAPSYNFSKNTAEFLGKEGFLYDSSLMADDIPYLIDGSAGELVELPSHWALDDWPHFTHNPDLGYMMPISSPEQAMEVFLSEFDAAWEFGGLWLSVWHPFVSGRLARCAQIDKMIQYMTDKGNVWFATLEEIALHVRKCIDDGTYNPRVDKLPYYDGPIPELTRN